jgi:hypothetical protein
VLVLGSWLVLQLPCKAAGWPWPKGAPLSVAGAGEPIARGRDAEVYALGDGRVLRRYRAPGPTGREMRVMGWASLLARSGGGLYWLLPAFLLLLSVGVIYAWVLLIEILR